MSLKNPFRTLVVGGGWAGATRKEGNHAAASRLEKDMSLIGVVDPDPNARAKAKELHGCEVFDDLEAALKHNPEIVTLAVFPEVRDSIFDQVLKQKSVRSIICEKPLGYSEAEGLRYVNKCRKAGINLYVNFLRLYHPTYLQLRADLMNRTYGEIQNVTMTYMRGLQANASHWVRLALMLFGYPEWISGAKSPIPSPYESDPNFTILLGYSTFHLHLIPLKTWQDSFYAGELDITFNRSRVVVPNSSHYGTKHTRVLRANEMLLEETAEKINIPPLENDFSPLFAKVTKDLREGIFEDEHLNAAVDVTRILDKVVESTRLGGKILEWVKP